MNFIAGWSSLVARQAHNLKVVGSNPTPATNHTNTFLILDTLKIFFYHIIEALKVSFWQKTQRNKKL